MSSRMILSNTGQQIRFGNSGNRVYRGNSSIVTPPPVSEFFNSSEVGGDGSDANIILADDFSRGWWYKADAEGKAGASRAVTVFTGSPDAPANIQYTAGWHAGIFGGEIAYPAGLVGVDVSATGRISPYAADHGFRDGIGGNYMAAHDLSEGVQDFWCRFDMYTEPGYLFGAEKVISVNPPNWGGTGGIYWAGFAWNIGSTTQATGNIGITLNGIDQAFGAGYAIQSGRWYSIQLRMKTGNPGADIVEIYVDDLGVNGTTEPVAGWATPTRRLNLTNTTIIPVSGGHTQFGSLWFENWANPASTGRWYFTNLMVSKVGPLPIRSS